MAATQIELTFPERDIAVLTLDDPHSSANVLSRHVLEQLASHLDAIDARGGMAGVVVRSAKPGIFIAGADLKEFSSSLDAPKDEIISFSRLGQQLFGRLSSGGYVSVAAIDGMCVGGGAELAVWCDRRVVSSASKTAFGFPEVKLGLFPGWGGTARTPRIVGLSNAIELITGGENIGPREMALMGLAEDVVPTPEDAGAAGKDALLTAAIRMIGAERQSKQYLRDRERWSGPIAMSDTELGFLGATASAYIQQQTKGHYPAPLAALEVVLATSATDIDSACEMEAAEFAKLFGSPINRALLNVFFLRDRNKKDPGVGSDIAPRKITSAGIVGAGVMGQGIAAANVKRAIPVALLDSSREALDKGVRAILGEVSYNKETKGPEVSKALAMAPLVNGTLSDAELCRSDIVIEAIFENPEAKVALYERIEPLLRDEALLCSNTSTIPISRLAAGLKRPERFCGLHFFNPVRQMPLVEVIRGEKTSDETIATAVAYAKSLGKNPIVMNDGPGFLVNRLLLPYMNEAVLLLAEGATIKQVDSGAKSFGMPMGPLTLYDVVGLDIAVHAGAVMASAFPDRVVKAEILERMFAAGRIGQKVGRGFFDYPPPKGGKPPRGTDSPEVAALIAQSRKGPQRQFTNDEIVDRLFLPMLLEATRILEDGLVRDVRDVDLALIFGIGFPPFKGGLFFWADTIGAPQIIERLQPYRVLGERYQPTAMLTEVARSNSRFYD